MNNLLRQLTSLKNSFTGLNSWAQLKEYLLFDSSWAAQEIAFMLSGEWDGCNGVVVTKFDHVAVNTAASLVGACWCHSGAHSAILPLLSVDELKQRYAAKERYFINANLMCADLNHLNLSGINLGWAKLKGADLSGVNLSGADLTAACLNNANLSGADLSGANLTLADLSGANLHEANLNGACLTGAKVDRL